MELKHKYLQIILTIRLGMQEMTLISQRRIHTVQDKYIPVLKP
jgi:hypothetical protein